MEQAMTAKQRGAIFGLAKKLGLDNDTLHDEVMRTTRKDSIAQLTGYEARKVIDRLMHLTNTKPLGTASEAQQDLIRALCRELGWKTETGAIDYARLEGFVKARFKIEKLNWLDIRTASRTIEALKSMKMGGRGERRTKEAAV